MDSFLEHYRYCHGHQDAFAPVALFSVFFLVARSLTDITYFKKCDNKNRASK